MAETASAIMLGFRAEYFWISLMGNDCPINVSTSGAITTAKVNKPKNENLSSSTPPMSFSEISNKMSKSIIGIERMKLRMTVVKMKLDGFISRHFKYSLVNLFIKFFCCFFAILFLKAVM